MEEAETLGIPQRMEEGGEEKKGTKAEVKVIKEKEEEEEKDNRGQDCFLKQQRHQWSMTYNKAFY